MKFEEDGKLKGNERGLMKRITRRRFMKNLAMAGAAVANSNQPSTTTVIVQQPASSWAIGTNFNSLPSGCSSVMVNYVQYFRCGPSWVRPYSGYYQVVPMPY